VGHLAAVAVAAAIAARVELDIAVPTLRGAACVPGLGSAAGLGEGWARVSGGPNGVRFEGAGGAVVELGGPGWQPRRAVPLGAGHTVAIEDQDPYRNCYDYRPLPHLGEAQARHFGKLLQDAWLLIERDHPRHAVAIRHGVRSIVPLTTPESGIMISAASRNACGSIAMSLPDDAADLALLLIHEHMHAKLGGLLDLVDLHEPSARPAYYAPWRLDPRPVGALLQGVYAHAGVTDYWRRRRASSDADTARAEAQFAYWGEMNRLATKELIGSGELTADGRYFVTLLGNTLDGWAAEPVDEDTAFHTHLFVLGQTVRWRLLNWRPTDAETERFLSFAGRCDNSSKERSGGGADGCSGGAGPTPDDWADWDALAATGAVIGDAQGRPADAAGILAGLQRWLEGRIAPAEPSGHNTDAAGAMLLRHDPDGALRACLARLDHDGADDDAWVGLAISRAWIARRAGRDDPIVGQLEKRPDACRAFVLKLQSRGFRDSATELVQRLPCR
jgi:uncharacterized protein